MRLLIAYSKMKKRNLVLTNNATYQRETLSERPIRQPLSVMGQKGNIMGAHFWLETNMIYHFGNFTSNCVGPIKVLSNHAYYPVLTNRKLCGGE